jgi:hypothetical protein
MADGLKEWAARLRLSILEFLVAGVYSFLESRTSQGASTLSHQLVRARFADLWVTTTELDLHLKSGALIDAAGWRTFHDRIDEAADWAAACSGGRGFLLTGFAAPLFFSAIVRNLFAQE